ncbi:transcriptional activator protein CopR [Ahrensia sp. R2A130]|nr:transcriptional activator protein CopR [Ahrensia sp. R2A130]
MSLKILLAEDDTIVAHQLTLTLETAGHEVTHVGDGEQGEARASAAEFDVLIVDRMMPKRDGLTMVSNLRSQGVNTPVLILSALGQVDDRVAGLRAGGDDYLTKPYAQTELLARVEALARRSTVQATETSSSVGDLSLDRLSRKAERSGEEIILQPREYRLLDYLMRHSGQLVTRTMLLENVWELNFDPQTNVIDVHVSRLRSKIDKGFDKPLLHTVRGKGYRLEALPD